MLKPSCRRTFFGRFRFTLSRRSQEFTLAPTALHTVSPHEDYQNSGDIGASNWAGDHVVAQMPHGPSRPTVRRQKGVYPYALRLRGAGQLRVIRDCKPTSRIARRLAIAGGINIDIDNCQTPTG
jgi:hypothetical protein